MGGGREETKCITQCCGTLISGEKSLDHSHWCGFPPPAYQCALPPVGWKHSRGRCLHCRWLLCGQGMAGGRWWGGSLRVDDVHSKDISTCGWRICVRALQNTELPSCNLLHNGAKCLLSLFSFLLHLLEEPSPACEQTQQCRTSWIFFTCESDAPRSLGVFCGESPDLGV